MLFENTQIAYQTKSSADLNKAYWLFKLVASKKLVCIGNCFTNFALRLHLPVAPLFKITVFDHFCGGTEKKDVLKVVHQLAQHNISSYVHYSVEGGLRELHFDYCLKKTLESFEFSRNNNALPYVVFKPTGFGRAKLFEKKSEGIALTEKEETEWKRIRERFIACCDKAIELNVRLLIDAEESWLQKAIDDLTEELMKIYNTEKPVIHTTLQMYRHDRLEYLEQLLDKGKKEGFKIGIKLVRGAYLEKEIKRAKSKGYPNPICADKNKTDENYDEALCLIFDHIENVSVLIGTHNEQSCYRAMISMKAKELANNHPNVWFAQLYGMSDHISFNLAEKGYQTMKHLPYGPVKEVIPYLIRRAEENTSIAGQTSRELSLIIKEKKRRKLNSA